MSTNNHNQYNSNMPLTGTQDDDEPMSNESSHSSGDSQMISKSVQSTSQKDLNQDASTEINQLFLTLNKFPLSKEAKGRIKDIIESSIIAQQPLTKQEKSSQKLKANKEKLDKIDVQLAVLIQDFKVTALKLNSISQEIDYNINKKFEIEEKNLKSLMSYLKSVFSEEVVKKNGTSVVGGKNFKESKRDERNNSLPTVQPNSNIPVDEESIEDNSKSDSEENLNSMTFSIQVCSLLSKLYTTLVHENGKKDDLHSIYHIELSDMEELLCYFKEEPLNEKSQEEPLIQISNSFTKLLNMKRKKEKDEQNEHSNEEEGVQEVGGEEEVEGEKEGDGNKEGKGSIEESEEREVKEEKEY